MTPPINRRLLSVDEIVVTESELVGTLTRMSCRNGLAGAPAGMRKGELRKTAWPSVKSVELREADASRKTCTRGLNWRRTVAINDSTFGVFTRGKWLPEGNCVLFAKSRLYFPALAAKAAPPSEVPAYPTGT